MRDITEKWLNWNKLGPILMDYQSVIADAIKADSRKILSTSAFLKSVTEDGVEPASGPSGAPKLSLKSFVEKRRAYLLSVPEISNAKR